MFDDLQEFDEDEIYEAADRAARDTLQPPRLNSECTGHEAVEKILLDYINSGQVPHALIFSGPEGIGKSTMAFRLARYLLKNGTGGDGAESSLFGDAPPPATSLSVGAEDSVFRKVASGGHPDLLVAEREVDEKKGRAKDALSVETVRKIAPFLRMTASDGGWRVVIVDDADTMTRAAQNGLLKILEEPPARALLILVVHRAGAMIPTIRSRCRVINFQPLSDEIVSGLVDRYEPALPRHEKETLCAMAGGSIGAAIRLLDEGGAEQVQSVLSLLTAWPDWDWVGIHRAAEAMGRRGQEDSYAGFENTLLWTIETMTRARARGVTDLPPPLTAEPLRRMLAHYSLEEWTSICDKLTEHFGQVKYASLDKRQGVLGAFSLIG